MEYILQVCGGSWQQLSTKHPKYYIFLETSGKIQFNEDDPNSHDHHKELMKDGGNPPSLRRFRTTILHEYPKNYIFLETSGKIQFNEDDANYHDHDYDCQQ